MIAVMGATGNTGSAVVRELRRQGAAIRAVTRDPGRVSNTWAAECEIVAAQSADVASLTAAFAGADAAYVLIPPHLQAEDALAEAMATSQAIAEAVTRAGLKYVVALSSGGAHRATDVGLIRALHDLEAALRRTSASVAFLRASDFMENWSFAVPVAVEHGVLPSVRTPFDAPLQTVSTEDIGRIAAECLIHRRDGERILNLLGPADYSPREVARAFGEILGKPVEIVPMPRETWHEEFVRSGIGEDYARHLADVYDGLNSGVIAFDLGEGETRRGSVTLVEAVRKMVNSTPE